MKGFFLALIGLVCVPSLVSAASVVRTGESVTVAADQVVEGDFYGMGSTAAISGTIQEDLLLTGGSVTLNGEVSKDVLIIGGTVDMHGSVGDDVRVVGGVVTVAGEIKGDLLVFASELKVLSTATVTGDLLFFGGTAEVAGMIGKNVLGTSETLRLDGAIGGGVDVTTRALTLGERVEVAGDVTYSSTMELVRAQNAEVQGSVIKNEDTRATDDGLRSLAVGFLILLFSALVIHLLLRSLTERVVAAAITHHFRSFTIGFGVMLLVPAAAIILFFSTLGSIVGIILIGLYIASLAFAIPLACIVVGSLAQRAFGKSSTISVLTVVIGTLTLSLCLLIPVLGSLFLLLAVFTALGAFTEHCYHLLHS
jgi:cytoskeletal protein CcmA (bactofilin family)